MAWLICQIFKKSSRISEEFDTSSFLPMLRVLPMDDHETYGNDLKGLREKDPAAIERLWASYFERLVGLARMMLPSHARRVTDEEDVALSAFHSLCAARGRRPVSCARPIPTISGGYWW